MKNNKGFVLMETIIVMSVLSLALITLYSSYVKIMSQSKSKNLYDTPEALYIADAIKQAYEYKTSTGTPTYLLDEVTGDDKPDKKAVITPISKSSVNIQCYSIISGNNSKGIKQACNATTSHMGYQNSDIKNIYNAFNIANVYVMKSSEFKNPPSGVEYDDIIKFFDGSTINYLKTIERSELMSTGTNVDLIIVKIKTKDGYMFGRSERVIS